VLKIRAHLYCW